MSFDYTTRLAGRIVPSTSFPLTTVMPASLLEPSSIRPADQRQRQPPLWCWRRPACLAQVGRDEGRTACARFFPAWASGPRQGCVSNQTSLESPVTTSARRRHAWDTIFGLHEASLFRADLWVLSRPRDRQIDDARPRVWPRFSGRPDFEGGQHCPQTAHEPSHH